MSQCQIITCDILLEFLEVAINEILYNRNLYPRQIFKRMRIYGTAVNISQHPDINDYVKNILEAIRELIMHDEKCVKKINLVFYNVEKVPIEKYVFHLIEFETNAIEKDAYFLKTEESLRTFCLKLSMTNSYLKSLPSNCTFSIEIDTHEVAHIAISENPKFEEFPWLIKEITTEIDINSNLLPLTTIKAEYLCLQIYIITLPIDKGKATN